MSSSEAKPVYIRVLIDPDLKAKFKGYCGLANVAMNDQMVAMIQEWVAQKEEEARPAP